MLLCGGLHWGRAARRVVACCVFLFSLFPAEGLAQRMDQVSLQSVSGEVDAWQREMLRRMRNEADGNRPLSLIDSVLRSTGTIDIVSSSASGLVALLRGDRPGRRVALRAVVAPIDSALFRQFTPCDGCLLNWRHAESALLLGTAKLLASMQGTLRGDVYFIFQVDTKGGCGGAEGLSALGYLQRVEAIYSMALEAGEVEGIVSLLRAGEVSPAEDFFQISVYGRGGNGASPDRGVDALVAGAALVGTLQTLVSRGASPWESTVVNVGRFAAGESVATVASRAHVEGVTYTWNGAERERVEAGVRAKVDGVAKAYGVAVRLNYEKGAKPLRNDGQLTEVVRVAAVKAVGKMAVRTRGVLDQGENLSCYASVAPLCMFTLSAGKMTEERTAEPYVSVNGVMGGLKVGVQLALEFLGRR